MFRLNWWQRKMESLDPNLLKYSLIEPSTAVFTIPEDLGKYQVRYSFRIEKFILSLAFGQILPRKILFSMQHLWIRIYFFLIFFPFCFR